MMIYVYIIRIKILIITNILIVLVLYCIKKKFLLNYNAIIIAFYQINNYLKKEMPYLIDKLLKQKIYFAFKYIIFPIISYVKKGVF